MLTDEQIRDKIGKVKESDEFKKMDEDRKKFKSSSTWVKPETIERLSEDELKKKFPEYFNNCRTLYGLNPIYRDRIIKDTSKFKKMLLYLLDESIPIEKRFKDVLEGEYHIDGVGKGLASLFLMSFNSEMYCIWNNRTEMGLRKLGWEVYETKDDVGTKYVKVLKALKRLRDEIARDLKLTFDEIDIFLYIISKEEETEGETTISPLREQCLQEMIEKNFDEIVGNKLGLELYQEDPDNPGSQYQTSVGKIDFLTRNKKTGDFVVIELKIDKAKDDALCQVLRYMGWVEENLAKDKNVSGIILTEDVDDRLKYAIKNVTNVKILTYKISLQIAEYVS